MTSETTSFIRAKRVCFECIGEPALRQKIECGGLLEECSYCQQTNATWLISEIAERVVDVLETCFRRRDEIDPIWSDVEILREPQTLQDLITDWFAGEASVPDDILFVLAGRDAGDDSTDEEEDGPFCRECLYLRCPIGREIDKQWSDFEHSLKTEARYFNSGAEKFLNSVFHGIEERRSVHGHPIVAQAGPRTALTRLYRARVFQKEGDFRAALKRPDVELGPIKRFPAPPSRMNAAGVSVFYGATNPEIALAEVRPPVGSKVLVACFDVTKKLNLLDLVALTELADEEGSLFSEPYLEDLKRSDFLRTLTQRLSRPVMPSDELFDYIPTQAIADFLARKEWPALDGIIYPSVQAGRMRRKTSRLGMVDSHSMNTCNVVLFHDAACVTELIEEADISLAVKNQGFLFSLDFVPDDTPNVSYAVRISPNSPLPQPGDTLSFRSLEAHYINGVKVLTKPMNL